MRIATPLSISATAFFAGHARRVLLVGCLEPAVHRGCEALGIQVVTGLDTIGPATAVEAFLQTALRPVGPQ